MAYPDSGWNMVHTGGYQLRGMCTRGKIHKTLQALYKTCKVQRNCLTWIFNPVANVIAN